MSKIRFNVLWLIPLLLLNAKFADTVYGESAREKYGRWNKAALERMAEAGLGEENRFLRGQAIRGVGNRVVAWPYPEEYFPYQWDFQDSMSGINEHGEGILNIRAEDGKLKFATGTEIHDAHFSWGDFDPNQKALRFGFDKHHRAPMIASLEVRLRQSLPESAWQAVVKRHGGATAVSSQVTVEGTDWQSVMLPFRFASHTAPPYTGARISTMTPGNEVEIDWVRPHFHGGRPCYRKTIELPDNVRWAKVSIASGPFHKLYVNGKLAVESLPGVLDSRTIWHYDIDPSLFRPGKNVIAVENEMIARGQYQMGYLLVDGALVCDDGSYHRFDTDTTWKFNMGLEGMEWAGSGYDDEDWAYAGLHANPPENAPLSVFWFNPSWKGRMSAAPADGRSQPVFGSSDDVAIKVDVIVGKDDDATISWRLFDEMGDGFHAYDTLVREGKLDLEGTGERGQGTGDRGQEAGNRKFGDLVGTVEFKAGELKHNVAYALALTLDVNGKTIEEYRYELAVVGPVAQPVVRNPQNYTDGMELKLIWETDAAAPQKEGEFISCDGWSKERESEVVETPLGRFRTPWSEQNLGTEGGGPANYISFKYTIENPGRPHVAIAEYPDDTKRIQEMRLNDAPPWRGNRTIGNDTVTLGYGGRPLTHEINHHNVLFFPNETEGTVSFFQLSMHGGWTPDQAAQVGRIWIYEILNDVPMREIIDAPGPRKWLGQQPEAGPRQVTHSCFSSPISDLVRTQLILSDRPNFYRDWLITGVNMVKRLRFAGENAYNFGQLMYDQVIYPSEFSEYTALEGHYGGHLRDCGVLLANIFGENELALFSSFEMMSVSRLGLDASDDAVARGAETLGQIDKHGKRHFWYRRSMMPNWIHPEVREGYFEKIMNEIIDLYGNEKGWKGITLQVNELLGPCWISKEGDPYFTSYDDYTIALFEKETNVKIPVATDDSARFTKRYEWLMYNAAAKKAWTDWRCDKMSELYDWLKTQLKETRPDLKLVLFPQAMSYLVPPFDERPEDALPSISDYARRGGFDPERFAKDEDVILALNVHCNSGLGTPRESAFRKRALDQRIYDTFSNDGINGIAPRFGWHEAQPAAPENWLWTTGPAAEAWLVPGGEYFLDYWTQTFIRGNPRLIVHSIQDITMWNGRETSMSRFAQAFRTVPATKYRRLTGNGLDRNVWIATGEYDGTVYGYVANPQWWRAEAEVTFKDGVSVFDLIENRPVDGNVWRVSLRPYAIHTFRIPDVSADAALVSCSVALEKKDAEYIENLIHSEEKRIVSHEEVLRREDRLESALAILDGVKESFNAGDFELAFETITGYQYVSLWTRQIINHKPGPHEPKTLEARRQDSSMNIDGDLSDWPDEPVGTLDAVGQVFPAVTDLDVYWEGTNDVSAVIRVQWDDEKVYLAADVCDDILYFNPGTLHRGDSVEVYFDMDPKGSTTLSDANIHLKFAPPVDGKDGELRVEYKRAGRESSADGITAMWKRAPGGYRMEMAVPWAMLTERPIYKGMKIGFDILVNDAESAGMFKQWMVWSAPYNYLFRNPSMYGTLVLGE